MNKKYLREDTSAKKQNFKLGVALGGGGSRGFAHAGALKAIDDAGYKVDVISGVSAGSIAAVLYAAGLKPETILKMFTEAKLIDLVDFSMGKGGMMRIDKFMHYFSRCLGKYKRIEDLPIPTYIGVTDFDRGEPVIFDKGEIAPIVQASCSIPIAMVPVNIDGTWYVDGGVTRNLPAWAIRDKCDKLIGINASPVIEKKTIPSLFSMAMRSYTLVTKCNQAQDMDMCDIVVKFDSLTNRSTFSLHEINKVFDKGYEEMSAALEKIKESKS